MLDKNKTLPVKQNGNSILITVPVKPVDTANTVIVLEIDGSPKVDPVVVEQQKDGIVDLQYVEAITSGKTVKRFNRKGTFHISRWTGPGDTISWNFIINNPGSFDVRMTYAANPEWEGQKYAVTVGEKSLISSVQPTGGLVRVQNMFDRDIGFKSRTKHPHYKARNRFKR